MNHRTTAPWVAALALFSSLSSGATPIASAQGIDSRPTRDPVHEPWSMEQWCSNLRAEIRKLNWKLEPCNGLPWRASDRRSVLGKPIPVAEFGDPKAANSTLVVSMVHGDENTPLYLVLKLAHYLAQNEELLRRSSIRVVVAPMVNPDGFFRKTRTRTNAHKVDLNRNLPTRDWQELALKMWKTKFGANARRFPGHQPASEPETLFQMELVRQAKPQKILSMHAPLNFMDYDGPSQSHLALARFPKDYIQECVKLRTKLKATSGGFYPGSLGNYTGQEMGIPTITLELPSAQARRADDYWKQFEPGIRTMIDYQVPDLEVSRLRSAERVKRASLER